MIGFQPYSAAASKSSRFTPQFPSRFSLPSTNLPTPSRNAATGLLACFTRCIQKRPSVLVIAEDYQALVPAHHDLVSRVRGKIKIVGAISHVLYLIRLIMHQKIAYPHQEGNNARPDRYLTAKRRCQFPMVDCFHSRSLEVGIGLNYPLLLGKYAHFHWLLNINKVNPA